MEKQENRSEAAALRNKAEELLKKKSETEILELVQQLAFQNEEKEKRADELSVAIANSLKLTHELQVHQIELEMQNDELKRAKEQIAKAANDKYAELYDFSPSGYFTLSKEGKIIELNLCGATMLGGERAYLKKAQFDFFVSEDTKPIFSLFLDKTFKNKAKESCEVTLTNHSNQSLLVHLSGIATENGMQCLVNAVDITERSQAEAETKKKSAILNNLIVNLQEGILLEDSNHKIALTNQLFCDMFSIPAPPEALIGADCSESAEQSKQLFTDPEKFVAGISLILINKKAVFGDELELLDGRHFERDYIPTWFSEVYSGHLWKYRDVTERKHAQQELQASEERYHSIFQGSPEGILIADAETKMITYANAAQCRVFGYTEEQFKTMSIAAIHPEETFGHTLAEFESMLHGEKALAENIQCLKENGEIFFADISGALISINGRTQLLGFFRDITARKNAEQKILDLNVNLENRIAERTLQLAEINTKLEQENAERHKISVALQEALDRLNKIANRVPGVVYQYRLNPDGSSCFPFTSEGIRDIYRVSPEDVTHDGSIVFSRIHPDDFANVVASMQASAKEMKLWHHEYRVKYDDGEVRWVLGNAMPQANDDGSVLWHGYISDITVRKQAEEALIAARNEADRANLAKSEFLSRMSHELRTPLNSILGFAQLMELGELKATHKKWINNILNSGKHLLCLINEVLELAGIESGRQILKPEPVGISGIINEISDVVQVLANQRNISIEIVDSSANNLFVLADKLRLTQVLLNLTSNAIKYNREGGSVTVKTALQPIDTHGNTLVRVSISDTGNGIKREDFTKLFQPFGRVGADQTKTQGTGLGLVVVKELIKAMNGAVGVESQVGVGSTFWIELPFTENKNSDQH